LKIIAESHWKEFKLYNEILKDLRYGEREEDLEIQDPADYDRMLRKLEENRNFLNMKELMEIKLLEWKTKAILKADGHEHELLEQKAKILEEAAERYAEIAKIERIEEAAAAEADEKQRRIAEGKAASAAALEIVRNANRERILKIQELTDKIATNKKTIEEREAAAKLKEDIRIKANSDALQRLLQHETPNLGLYKTNSFEDWSKVQGNEGKTQKVYKEHMYKKVQTWG